MSCRDYLYRGRHRQGRSPGRAAGALGTVAAAGLLAFPGSAAASDAGDVLGSIAQCESGGNARASNGSHFGLYQFDLQTWRSVGGAGHPLNASASAQHAAAQRLLAQRGTQPWNASKACWSGRHAPVRASVAPAKRAPARVVSTPAPHHAPVAAYTRPHPRSVSTHGSAVPDGYRVRSGDTLGKLAHRYHTSVGQIARANHIANPDRIYVGSRLV